MQAATVSAQHNQRNNINCGERQLYSRPVNSVVHGFMTLLMHLETDANGETTKFGLKTISTAFFSTSELPIDGPKNASPPEHWAHMNY